MSKKKFVTPSLFRWPQEPFTIQQVIEANPHHKPVEVRKIIGEASDKSFILPIPSRSRNAKFCMASTLRFLNAGKLTVSGCVASIK